jgi:sarcosine oxidase gamma subunit
LGGDPEPSDTCFHIHVARSYFTYLHSWLLDAAIEFEATTATA